MKGGYLIKSASCGEPRDDELKLINNYTRRMLKKDEVYVFSVVLCDNEIDRDYECFTKEALAKIAELFVGKTGISDHEMKSENQKARIFACCLEEDPNRLTSYGDTYLKVVAKAYMPKLEGNKDLILELDSGIKKEVSISCSVARSICSICGADSKVSACRHVRGRTYDNGNKICYTVLDDPQDAYEWSFVAVPAQRNAGVIKGFLSNQKGGAMHMNEILKEMKMGNEILINKAQSKKLYDFISELEELAEDGKLYKEDLRKEVVRLCSISQPSIKAETMSSVAEKMTIKELKSFKKSFESKSINFASAKPQLAPGKNKKDITNTKNVEFKI